MYQEIVPGEKLRPFVKCYFLFESASDFQLQDTVFPGGYIEFIFNLGEAKWESAAGNIFHRTPPVELWGQLTQPLPVKTSGKNKMLGIRFFSHTAAYFIEEEIWEFNNQVCDLRDLMGDPVRTLHARLTDASCLDDRIELLEKFLIGRLSISERKTEQIGWVGQITAAMRKNSYTDDIETMASSFGITTRYLQKLFVQHIGIPPKLYCKISRFQQSLQLLNRQEQSLTSIAYDCGYFDQSHFIREFKAFTGLTPSNYSTQSSPFIPALVDR